MTAEETIFQEVLSAFDQGEKARARDLLTRLLKMDSNKIQYWLWMSAVVETSKERIYCLNEILRRDPQNETAKRGLILFGVLTRAQNLPPAPMMKRNWQAGLKPNASSVASTRGAFIYLLAGAGSLLLIALIGVSLFGQQLFKSGSNKASIRRLATFGPTVTYQPTPSPWNSSPTPVFREAEPLWMQLSATYTPTPLYVNTPHARTESYRIALRAYDRQDWPAALNYFQQVATDEPTAPDIWYYLGEVYRMQNSYEKASEAYHKAVQINKQFAPAYLGLARVLIASKPEAVQEAEKNLLEALNNDPKYAEAALDLAALYINTGRSQPALEILEQAAGVLQSSAQFYVVRARSNLAEGNLDAALADAKKAKELDLTFLAGYKVLGQVLQMQGDFSGSLGPLETYCRYGTDDAQAFLWLGKAFEAGGQVDAALQAYNRALSVDEKNVDGYMARGWLYLGQKDDAQKALEDFNAALQLKTNFLEAAMGKGRALLSMGYNGDSYVQFNRSEGLAKSDSEKAQLYYWRALSLEGLKNSDPKSINAAVHDWQALLALPGDSFPKEWSTAAQEHLQSLYTETPTPKPSATRKLSSTPAPKTPSPSQTVLPLQITP